jgi:hypothetical protein
MTPRSDRLEQVSAAFLFFGSPVAALIILLGLWLMQGPVFQEIFETSDKLTADASSKQLLSWILGLIVNGGIGVIVFCFMLWVQLWMIGITLLLILRELREINVMRR